MTIELKMNTLVRDGVRYIRNGEVNPIIDLDNVRYLLDVETHLDFGGIIWTRFNLTTAEPLDEVSYTRHWANHNRFYEIFLVNATPIPRVVDEIPTYPVPDINGTVTP